MKKKWKTKDGRKIKIKYMTDQHLINTIRYCFNKSADYAANLETEAYLAMSYTGGEMAELMLHNEAEALLCKLAEIEKTPIVPDQMPYLIKEAQRRGLELPANYNPDFVTVSQVKKDEFH